MRRGIFSVGAAGVLALAVAPWALLVPAHAAPMASTAGQAAAPSSRVRPDPSFGLAQRKAAVATARSHAAGTARLLRLGSAERLVVRDVMRDTDGTEHVRYDRTYAGLPVIGGDLVIAQAPTGKVAVRRATRARIAVPSTGAPLAGQAARTSAAQRAGLRAGTAAPVKVVYAAQHAPVLAWQTTVTGTTKDGTPIRDLAYTDARTGRQLARLPQVLDATGTGKSLYSGTVKITTTLSGSTYQLVDGSRGGHRTYDKLGSTTSSRGTLFTDSDNVWGNGSTSSRQSTAVDAAYGAQTTWNYYKAHFGRLGIRNDGVAAYSRVHYGKSYENAFWDDSCFCMTYGDGGTDFRPLTSLDVAGHEMSHGVTAATAGLDYVSDAGGLNESTSDVMGTMVEFEAANPNDPGDYYIGEKVLRDGTYLRRMDNPSLDGGSVNCWSATTGALDPHYSSGVGNHLFYLLAEGTGSKTIGGRAHKATSCNSTTFSGIGRTTAAAIWYRALTTYWVSTTTYPQAANGMVDAARDLYGASSTQCAATVRAWKAVRVLPTESCTGATVSSDGNLLANPGFEQGAASWTATTGAITSSTDRTPHAGSFYAWLDGYGSTHTDSVRQTVTVPAASAATLAFYLEVDSQETTTTAKPDTLAVQVTSGGTTHTIATYSNLDAGTAYVRRTVNLSAYTGKTVTLTLLGVESASVPTSFLVDDLALTTG